MERILGVNLSGWFIPEPWVTPSLYAATGASNAAELQEAMGTAAYNECMRRHYETFVSEDDFRRMAQIGLNAVRLPSVEKLPDNMTATGDRAEAVKKYLVGKGIEANRVYTEGKGEKQPVADNKTDEGRAKNRRVEIEVVGTRTK